MLSTDNYDSKLPFGVNVYVNDWLYHSWDELAA